MDNPHNIPHHQIRYYNEPPQNKTVAQCKSHGDDHRAYGWTKQIDPRWSAEQIAAYNKGYEGR